MVRHGCRSAGRTARSYSSITRRSRGPPSSAACVGAPSGRRRVSHAASDGVSVTASTSEVSSETTIVSASARKNTPVMPRRNASGMNTTTGVSVDPTSGRKISPMPATTASARLTPRVRRVWIASTTTMASSITRPIAAAIPPSVIRLNVRPVSFIDTSVMSTVTGMTVVATSVVSQLLRNTKRIRTESARPKMIASHTLSTEARTISD